MDTKVNTSKAAQALNAICDAQPFVTRFMARNLLTGETIGRGADEETPSASTRKTSIMMAAPKDASIWTSRSSTKSAWRKRSPAACSAT